MQLATIALAAAAAAGAVRADLFADSFSQSNYNFTLQAIYDSAANATHFTLQSGQAAKGGWVGIGTGSDMDGSSMVVSWVNADKSTTLSQRHATGEVMPQTTGLVLPAIDVNRTASVSSASDGTTFAWTQPGFPTGSTDAVKMIWAVNADQTPQSAATDATIYKHDNYGYITLNLQKPYQAGAAVAPSPASSDDEETTDRTMTKRNKLIIAHMVLAIVGWLILVPLGIFIARFGRTTMVWFPKHRAVQLVSIVVIVIAMGLGFATITSVGGTNFNERHHVLGLTLTILAVVQGIMGQLGHSLWHAKRIRVLNYLHIVTGVTLFGLAPWNMVLGFDLWTPWNPSPAGKWICVAWAALLGVVYLAGLALVPRESAANQRAQAYRAGLVKNPSDGALEKANGSDEVLEVRQ